MPTGHKIALFGIGSIGRLAYTGIDALTLSETKNEKFDFDILTITEPADYSTLVKAYKKVKQKYNPEGDVYNFKNDKGILNGDRKNKPAK